MGAVFAGLATRFAVAAARSLRGRRPGGRGREWGRNGPDARRPPRMPRLTALVAGPWPSRVCGPVRIGYSSERTPVVLRASPERLAVRGRGSVGRASPCQGEGRGFESRRPLGSAGSRLASRRPARLRDTQASSPERLVAEWPSGLGKGLQSPVRGFDSRFRLCGRLAQRESTSLTRKGSLVQSQYRPRTVRV
jgi:hypothetical protein